LMGEVYLQELSSMLPAAAPWMAGCGWSCLKRMDEQDTHIYILFNIILILYKHHLIYIYSYIIYINYIYIYSNIIYTLLYT
jgi:hypothetical protein